MTKNKRAKKRAAKAEAEAKARNTPALFRAGVASREHIPSYPPLSILLIGQGLDNLPRTNGSPWNIMRGEQA